MLEVLNIFEESKIYYKSILFHLKFFFFLIAYLFFFFNQGSSIYNATFIRLNLNTKIKTKFSFQLNKTIYKYLKRYF